MITSGLVITLSSDATLAAEVTTRLSARAEFTPGERNDRWLPVAMEARGDAESRDLHDWLHALPGVAYVDVVSVSFDESEWIPADSDEPPMEGIIGGCSESAEKPSTLPLRALDD